MADHDDNSISGCDSGKDDPDSNQSGGDAPKKKLRRRRPQGYFTDGHGDPLQNLIKWTSTREPTRTGAGSIILDSFINTPPPGVSLKKEGGPGTGGPGSAGGPAEKRGFNEPPLVAFSKGPGLAFRSASEKAMMEQRHQIGDLELSFRRATDINSGRRSGDLPRKASDSLGSEHGFNRGPNVDRDSVSVRRSYTQDSWPPRRHHPYAYSGPLDADRPIPRRDPDYVKPVVDPYGELDMRYPNRDGSGDFDPYVARRAPSDGWSGRHGPRPGWNLPPGRPNPNLMDNRYYEPDGYDSPEARRPNGFSGYRGGGPGDGPTDYVRGRYERDNWRRDEPVHSDHEGGPVRSRHEWSGHDNAPMGGGLWPQFTGELGGRYSDPEALRPRVYAEGMGGHSPLMDEKTLPACEYEGCMSHHKDGFHHHRAHPSSGPREMDDPAYFRMGRGAHSRLSPNTLDRRWGGRAPEGGSPRSALKNTPPHDSEYRGMRKPPTAHADFWRGKMARDMMDTQGDRWRGDNHYAGDSNSIGPQSMDGRYRDGIGNQSPATTTLAEMSVMNQLLGPCPARNGAVDPTGHQNGAEVDRA